MPTIPAKSGPRAKILAYLNRNGLSTTADIMAGIGEPVRTKAQNNINAAAQDGLIVRKRDDVTNQPAYEITEAGRAWLKANGREPNPKAPAKATPPVCTKSQTTAAAGDSEGGEADAPVSPLTEARREEFTLLGVIADIRKAIGDEGRIMLGDLAGEIGNIVKTRRDFFDDFKRITKVCEPLTEQLVPHDSFNIAEAVQIALQRLKDVAALQSERDDLRARLDAVTQQSVKDIGLLTEKNDTLHNEIDHLRADLNNAQRRLETLSAENLALKTLEEAMPGFGAEHQAQRIQTLETQLAEARADARHLEDRLDAFITKELVTSEPGTPRGFILRADKRPDLSRSTFKQHENAVNAGATAIRKGAKRVRIYALVPAGQVVPGAEFKN